MKRKNFILICLIVIVLTGLSSCKKYLEQKSDTSLVVPTTIEDYQALLDGSKRMNFVTPSLGMASTDDYFWLDIVYDSYDEYSKKYYSWIPTESSEDWGYGYFPVYPSNLSLEGLNKINKTSSNQDAWNNVKGSALFYRSYSFLNLIWTYGKAYDKSSSSSDLGIALKLESDPNLTTTRASVAQSYGQVISDAKLAIQFLPSVPLNTIRPSKASAYGLLARAYLSMREYDSAFKYSNLSLNINSYLMDYNGDPGINNLYDDNAPFNIYNNNKEITFYSTANSVYSFYGTSEGGTVDTTLYESYKDKDLRKRGYFSVLDPSPPYNNYFQFKGSYSADRSIFFTGITTAEMFLIRAECYARGVNGNAGNKTAALADLNTLMIKRWENGFWIPIDAIDAGDALNKILSERRKELLFRGLRWIDIKRLNKEGRNIVLTRKLSNGSLVTLQPNANYYALPLPQDIIDLTGIPQNPY